MTDDATLWTSLVDPDLVITWHHWPLEGDNERGAGKECDNQAPRLDSN
jgi:hypothetical protein